MLTLHQKQVLFVQNVAKLIQFAFSACEYELTAGEFYRTPEQQARDYASGLSKTLDSQHTKRLAVDFNLFINGIIQTDKSKFKVLAEFWINLHPNNKAGYFWGWDAGHFEMQ